MEPTDQNLPKITPSSPEEIDAYNKREWDRISVEILSKANFPLGFARNRLALYQKHPGWSEAFLTVQELLKPVMIGDAPQFGRLIAITGIWSTGKTAMAIETLRNQAKTNHRSVYFSTQAEYLQRWGTANRCGDYSMLNEDFEDRGILVLDDVLGCGRAWESNAFHALVMGRYSRQQDTILTCSMDRPQLLEQILPPGLIPKLNNPQTSKVIHLDYPGFNA